MTHHDLGKLRQQAGELDARLAAARHTAKSADQLVTAVVTGQAKLLDLRIDDGALTGPHAQQLGLSIVEAVRNARDAARASALPQLNALFGKEPLPGAAPSAPARGPVQRQREPDDESFEELDFLTDEGPDSGGGRW
ncbi:YbaB/EbfC family nucleoid-associated protein [Amycolatopsis sp. OK19-0408]|uniref:YbaB/EbfC family nucleoid-associated protein n=1 Tax=Amycolatopsis iheyensis TaxID=2945988 RepID=A0A9X2N641_9PSEU|nr:YbaB/EbfC family nucleoid-associated protein [Amycolatopsis iheyensis]MCR6481236.1 YbaB/EbfC family nucleoid-associated protein [Amycolatopsis iheyensis]